LVEDIPAMIDNHVNWNIGSSEKLSTLNVENNLTTPRGLMTTLINESNAALPPGKNKAPSSRDHRKTILNSLSS